MRVPINGTLFFIARLAVAIMEVKSMNAKKIWNAFGTCVIICASSIVGTALWTNVLEDKYYAAKERITNPPGNNVIDFIQAKKRMDR